MKVIAIHRGVEIKEGQFGNLSAGLVNWFGANWDSKEEQMNRARKAIDAWIAAHGG